MPRSNRRRQTRRRPPPRPTYRGAPAPEEPAAGTQTVAPVRARASRPAEYIARQTPYLFGELRRVLLTTIACFGLLALLVVVDRLQ